MYKEMSTQRTLRRAATVVSLLAAFLFQETWALAGVTGNIGGTIKDASGAPIAGATVQAVSPSETRSATTDAGGHFIILSLAPDTYTLNLSKEGYQSLSYPGVSVFADQSQQVAYMMQRALRTIARVTSTAGASLVRSGVGSDLYSVNATQAAAAAALGGGGNLNSAYSAMASVPGVQTSAGGMGWDFNAAYVRGQNSYYTGFEYDGIPVNRAFDNYNSSTESSVGLQELQVYTGGGPSSVASAGTAGFINQVIKTGTFPGYGSGSFGVSTPGFYNQGAIEIAGSTPNREFSYYIGLLGYNQDYRSIDVNNGANLSEPGGIYSGATTGNGIGYICTTPDCQGVKPSCPLLAGPSNVGFGSNNFPTGAGCWQYYSGITNGAAPQSIADRENVINLHWGIAKHNGLRDDIQAMWSGSALNNYFYQSPNDVGPGFNQFSWALFQQPYAAPTCGMQTIAAWAGLQANACSPSKAGAYLPYADSVAYDLPFGTPVARSATSFTRPGIYAAPDTPAHAFDGPIPLFDNNISVMSNDTGITKLQYTYALSQSAYLRAYGYTMYSDWEQVAPVFGATVESTPTTPVGQYLLYTHTAGGAVSFDDQINDQNLVNLDANYTSAGVTRFNNSSAYSGCLSATGCSPIGYMSLSGSKATCFDPTHGTPQPCILGTNGSNNNYYNTNLKGSGFNCAVKQNSQCFVTPTWVSNAQAGPTGFGHPGATWNSLWDGNATGSLNTVGPRFTNASLSDQFRPNDKVLFNASIRFDNFTYELPQSADAATNFYAGMTANFTCVLAATNEVLTQALPPGVPPPAQAQFVNGNCNQAAAALHPSGPHTGWVHPNGTVQNGVTAPSFTSTSPSSYALNYWEPRFSATYTLNPDTVVRASAGRFTQPPISASVQYLSATGDDRSVWNNTMGLGFYSPFHPIPGISSAQYDASLEHHFKGTDVSFKITPFYTWVNQWQQQTFIGAGFVTQVPVGVNRNYGAEFQLNKGDFNRSGWSGQLAFTYTNSKVQFQNQSLSTGGVIPNTTIALNQAIAQYNDLTKAGGGSACYRAGKPVSCNAGPITISGSTFDTVANPYYNKPAQGELDPNGWYNPYTTAIAPNLFGNSGSYISPLVSSLLVNYRHDKLAVTPSLVFQSGAYYGGPLDITGYDPRTCQLNSLGSGITKLSPKTNPLQCNYLTTNALGLGTFGFLYIPDPQTGFFSAMGSFQNPDLIVGNLQVSYDINPKVRLTLVGANLFHTCFGGSSEPWTTANPPGPNVCGYTPAGGPLNTGIYPSNFYNGTSMNDLAANKVRPLYTQSYYPSTTNNNAIGAAPPPFSIFFTAQVKI